MATGRVGKSKRVDLSDRLFAALAASGGPRASAEVRQRPFAFGKANVFRRGFGRGAAQRPVVCSGDSFEESADGVVRGDYQEIRLQALASTNSRGSSRSLTSVVLLGDLAGRLSPGDFVAVVGIASCRWQRLQKDLRCSLELFVEANNLHLHAADAALNPSAPFPPSVSRQLRPQHRSFSLFFRENRLSSLEASGGHRELGFKRFQVADDAVRAPSPKDIFGGFWNFVRGDHATEPVLVQLRRELLEKLSVSTSQLQRPGFSSDQGALPRLDEWKIRKEIIEGLNPTLHGIPVAKLAVLLAVIGGCDASETSPFPQSAATQKRGAVEGRGSVLDRWAKFRGSESGVLKEELPPREDIEGGSRDDRREGVTSKDPGNANTQSAPSPPNPSSGLVCRRRRQQETLRHACHLLLLGDAGAGKSQLLRAATRLAPHAVSASGVGCSAAGLTCAAVRDAAVAGGDWLLEAGSLVLADGGLCCVDGFDALKRDAQQAILEAMEQQTVSVAKAGMVCSLNTRCSIFAAAHADLNEEGEESGTLFASRPVVPSRLSPPLLSRFDVVLVVPQAVACSPDVVDFLLKKASDGTTSAADNAHYDLLPWNPELLRLYVSFIRNSFQPRLSKQAEQVLTAYYLHLRASTLEEATLKDEAPVSSPALTVRFLESLGRLTQAHARLMARHAALLRDAVAVVWLFEMSLGGRCVVPGNADSKTGQVGKDTWTGGRFGLLPFASSKTQAVIRELSESAAEDPSLQGGGQWPEDAFPETGGYRIRGGKASRVAALRCVIASEKEFLLVRDLLLEKLGLRMPPASCTLEAAETLEAEGVPLEAFVTRGSPLQEEEVPLFSEESQVPLHHKARSAPSVASQIEAEHLCTTDRFEKRRVNPHILPQHFDSQVQDEATSDEWINNERPRKRPWS